MGDFSMNRLNNRQFLKWTAHRCSKRTGLCRSRRQAESLDEDDFDSVAARNDTPPWIDFYECDIEKVSDGVLVVLPFDFTMSSTRSASKRKIISENSSYVRTKGWMSCSNSPNEIVRFGKAASNLSIGSNLASLPQTGFSLIIQENKRRRIWMIVPKLEGDCKTREDDETLAKGLSLLSQKLEVKL